MKVKPFFIFLSLIALATTNVKLVFAATKDDNHQEAGAHENHSGHGHEKKIKEKEKHGEHKEHGHEKKSSRDEHKDHDEHADPGGHEGHDEHAEEGVIKLNEEARKMVQLKTETVRSRQLGNRLKIYGKIAKDTEDYSYITYDNEGRVKKLFVELGDIVSEGDPLVSIELPDGQHKEIISDIHGMVFSIFANPGDRVDRLTSLISIMNIDTLRATADIYEKDLRFVKVGQKVELSTAAFPDQKFYGKVVYISPQVDEHSQSIKARLDIDNSEHLLRLGMFFSAELIYASKNSVLTVPIQAIQTLNEEDVVFVEKDGDRLELREVVLGRKMDDYVEIKKGLHEGEVVVTKGSFYLKSEQAKEGFGDGHNH